MAQMRPSEHSTLAGCLIGAVSRGRLERAAHRVLIAVLGERAPGQIPRWPFRSLPLPSAPFRLPARRRFRRLPSWVRVQFQIPPDSQGNVVNVLSLMSISEP